ncbi:MAG: hypothetical protein PHY80_00235 [Rickettsiales bacterium]|nr:hypothetical protein [Rickettsiales bacterium]
MEISMVSDELKKTKTPISKPKVVMSDFLSAITKPNAIQEACKKETQEKLERGETVVGKDKDGVYFMKKQHDGTIEKKYQDKNGKPTSTLHTVRL